MVKHIFHVSHCNFLFENKMHILNPWFIEPGNFSILLHLFHIYYLTIVKWLMGKFFKGFIFINWPYCFTIYTYQINSTKLLWIFSFYWNTIDCWLVCSHWSDMRHLILKLVPGCVIKLYVVHIPTGNKYLLLPQASRMLREAPGWGFILVHTNWLFWFN